MFLLFYFHYQNFFLIIPKTILSFSTDKNSHLNTFKKYFLLYQEKEKLEILKKNVKQIK